MQKQLDCVQLDLNLKEGFICNSNKQIADLNDQISQLAKMDDEKAQTINEFGLKFVPKSDFDHLNDQLVDYV